MRYIERDMQAVYLFSSMADIELEEFCRQMNGTERQNENMRALWRRGQELIGEVVVVLGIPSINEGGDCDSPKIYIGAEKLEPISMGLKAL